VAGACVLVSACQTAPGPEARPAPRSLPPAQVTISGGNLSFTSGSHTRTMAAARAGGTGAAGTGGGAGSAGAAGHTDNRPDLGITVRVTGGRLGSVVVTGGAGKTVPGTLGPGAASWHTAWALAPARSYRVSATARNAQGRLTAASAAFRTLTPRRSFTATTSLLAGQAYGVGMPIMITFSRPVRDRAEVERALEIWSSKPVTGAWYWMSNHEVWFRPRSYWPAHTRVRVEAHLRGVRAAPGLYGSANLSRRFRIGNSLIVRASASNHHMKVWWNGRLRGAWPISTGQPGLDTPDGHYLSFAMGNPVRMDSATFGVMPGDPGYYNVLVYDSVQFTESGDYVHSAPWSVGEQGYTNVSHGCVNVAPGNAAWYYAHSLIGDPITVTGSPVRGSWGDGWTIWFLSWRKLLGGSATGQTVLAGPGGSRSVPASAALPAPAGLRGHFRP
jgi:lipoprotein-anchoring transpeptidase ErfK/SrfK